MTAETAALARTLARTGLWLRGVRALRWSAHGAALLAGALLCWSLLSRLLWHARAGDDELLFACVLTSLVAALGLLAPLPRELVARSIDRRLGLHGRVAAADEFTRLAPERRSPFMEAAIRDAALRVASVRGRDVAPLYAPQSTWLAVLCIALTLALDHSSWQLPTAQRSTTRSAAPAVGIVLSADDVQAARLRAAALGELAPALAEARARYMQLLSALERGELEPALAHDALRELQARVGALRADAAADLPAALAQLDALHATLREAEAKTHGASDESRELALRLVALGRALHQRKLADHERTELEQALAEARADKRDRATAGEPQLLGRERNAEARERGATPADQPQRQLERLRRELSRAVDALARGDRPSAQQALAQAAEALERAQREHQARAALQRELSRFRELLAREQGRREQAADSASRALQRAQRERFDQRARGERDRGASEQARDQRATDGGSLALLAPRTAEPRSSQVDAGSARLVRVEVEREGQAGLAPEMDREPASSPSSTARGAPTMPTKTRADHSSEATPRPPPRASYDDRALPGVRAAGPSRSQVIGGAASGGFSSRSYGRVYSDYRAHAEALIERESVPEGYRYHVQRYFELVRPRGAGETP